MTGMDFRDYLRSRILDPSGLSSFFVGMPDEVQSLYTIADNVYGNPATEKQVRKRSLLLSLPFLLLKSFLYVKHDHLPRQARNKHEGQHHHSVNGFVSHTL